MESSKSFDAREVHSDQRMRVTAALVHEGHRDVYRRRLLAGRAAATVRDAVRTTVSENLRRSNLTHNEVAELAAQAADHALAMVGIEVERIGCDRVGWRGRLANIEHLLCQANEGTTVWPNEREGTSVVDDALFDQALSELRAVIDSVHES